MKRIAPTLLILAAGLLALLIMGACGTRPEITPNPTGTVELPTQQPPSMTYDLPVAPEISDGYTDEPSETLEPTFVPSPVPEQSPRENTTHKPLETPKAQKGLSGDDNGDGRIDEDESGWDCHNMGNGVCGKSQSLDTSKVACRGQKGTDAGDTNKNGWIDPYEGAWASVCAGKGTAPTAAQKPNELPTEMWCVVGGEKITPQHPSWPAGCPGA